MSDRTTLDLLSELKPQSSRRLPGSVVDGLPPAGGSRLIQMKPNPSGPGHIFVPAHGWILLAQNTYAARKLMTIDPDAPVTARLNKALAGGESYPILTALLAGVAGLVGGPTIATVATVKITAGVISSTLFAFATTYVDTTRAQQDIQARPGDEIWSIEVIGKTKRPVSPRGGPVVTPTWVPVHVGSCFLVDPYRGQAPTKGWLLHECRTELTV